MHIFRRTLYLLYYIKESDFRQLGIFITYSAITSGKSRIKIVFDALLSVYKYNVSFKDYFCFRFYELNDVERRKWAGSGFMYEYQLMMNPRNSRKVLEDKIQFLNFFSSFVKRNFSSLKALKEQRILAENLLLNSSGLLVLKGSHGQIGAEVEVIKCSDYNPETLLDYMTNKSYDLAEEYVIQHPDLMGLSPSGLNTVRIFTQLHAGKVDFLGARLRITVNSQIDNMAAGNLASPVDIETGNVFGPGVYSDITRDDMKRHPITGKTIKGFTVPFWQEVINMTKEAALLTPENKSVGWDIAITPVGPELIEGNHNWCKLLWQMPVKKGLRGELEKYL